jgi:spore coat protein GerQ
MNIPSYDTYGYGAPQASGGYGTPQVSGMPGVQYPTGWWPSGYDAAMPFTAGMTGVSPFMTSSGIPSVPSGAGITPTGGSIVTVPQEESYVENILRLNRGKRATVYMTFENNSQWNAKVFRGIIEAAGRDHIILSDPATGTRYLLLMVNLDYITFDEPINYEYPFQGGIVTQQTPFPTGTRESDYTERNTQA